MATITVTAASEPGLRPISAEVKLTRRLATPERSNSAPSSTNIGIASRGYLAMPVYVLVGIESTPSPASQMARLPATPSATAIGAPTTNSSAKLRNSAAATTAQISRLGAGPSRGGRRALALRVRRRPRG